MNSATQPALTLLADSPKVSSSFLERSRNAQRAGDRKTISAFWTRAEKHREAKVIAAKAVLEDVERYGGETAGVVISARITLRNETERKAAKL